MQSWFAQLAMACGRDSLFIYSWTLVLDVAANLALAVTHGGVLLETQLTIFGLALLCGMAWLRRHNSYPLFRGLPVPSRVTSSAE